MTKRDLIKEFNELKESAQIMRSIAEQNIALAARLETTAISALNELGVQTGRARKSKKELPPDILAEIIARSAQ